MKVKRTPHEARQVANSIAASLKIEGRTLNPELFEIGVAIIEGRQDAEEAIRTYKKLVRDRVQQRR